MRAVFLDLIVVCVLILNSCGSSSKTEDRSSDKTEDTSSETTGDSASKTEDSISKVESSNIAHLKMAAFNADILGKTKMAKTDISGYIADIIIRYDVILIQEVRDISEETPKNLLSLVNSKNKGVFAIAVSERLGRTSSKEQYVYFYREDIGFKIEKAEVYKDSSDIFEREPYLIKFSKGSLSFVLIGIHIKPDDAVNELNHLDDVYDFATTTYAAGENIILGDLNADCSYVSDSEFQSLDLVKQGFTFSIAKNLDTTVTSTDCAYDNIVSKSKRSSNAAIFNFKSAYGLDNDTAEAVSNHFPIEFELSLEK